MRRSKCLLMGILFLICMIMSLYARTAKEPWRSARLFDAVIAGNKKPVEEALAAGVDPNTTKHGMGSMLVQATIYGHLDIIKLLLAHGADPRASGNEALAIAAVNTGKMDILKLIVEAGASISAKKKSHSMADIIVDALENKRPDMAIYLLRHGATPNGVTLYGGISSLQIAAMNGYLSVMRMLLAKGAEIDYRDWNGWSALVYACKEGEVEAVKLLLANGADPTLKDRYGRTAETFAGEYKGKHAKELRVLCAGKGGRN